MTQRDRCSPSVRAASSQDDMRGLEQDVEIEQQVLVTHVVRVQHYPPAVIGVVSALDLPQARDAGPRGQVRAYVATVPTQTV